ncbi:MAG: hypothetical protein JWP65_74, partial [Ramlibacter sp.]|nr:hypothetical protein [Ramlibacter sp.]
SAEAASTTASNKEAGDLITVWGLIGAKP